jgi:hypothetical protein
VDPIEDGEEESQPLSRNLKKQRVGSIVSGDADEFVSNVPE